MTHSASSFEDYGKNETKNYIANEDARIALIGVKELYIITQELRQKIKEIEELKAQMNELNKLTQYLFKHQQKFIFCKPDSNA